VTQTPPDAPEAAAAAPSPDAPLRFLVDRKSQPIGEKGVRFSLEEVARRSTKGRLDPHVRAWTVQQIKKAKDEGQPVGTALERAKAILSAVRKEFVYVPDPYHSELMTGPHLLIKGVIPGGDCFPLGTTILTRDQGLRPVEEIAAGRQIWGLNGWTRVLASTPKGTMPIHRVLLGSGAQVWLTEGHKVNVRSCPKHPHRDASFSPCSCPANEQDILETRVADLLPKMLLVRPDELPLDHSDPETVAQLHRLLGARTTDAADLTVCNVPVLARAGDEDETVQARTAYCVDLQTEDHHVYLPQHDVTVRNCDDLTIVTLSCFLSALSSVGVRCAVVGHAYDRDRQIQHVLAAVFDQNKWWYADPSTDAAFGSWAVPPSRERVIDVPCGDEAPAFCDADLCLAGLRSVAPPIVRRAGDFVGVDGLPESPLFAPVTTVGETARIEGGCPYCRMPLLQTANGPLLPHAPTCHLYLVQEPSLPQATHRATARRGSHHGATALLIGVGEALVSGEQVGQEMAQAWGDYVASARDALSGAFAGASRSYDQMRATAQAYNIQIPAADGPYHAAWNWEDDARMADVYKSSEIMLHYLDEAISGQRKIYAMPDGDLGIEQLPQDTIRVLPPPAASSFRAQGAPPKLALIAPTEPGVGAAPLVILAWGAAISAVALTLSTVLHGAAYASAITSVSDNSRQKFLVEQYAKQRKDGATHEQIIEQQNLIQQGQIGLVKARTDENLAAASKPNPAVDALKAITWLAVGLGGVYVVVEGAKIWKDRAADQRSERAYSRRPPASDKTEKEKP